MALATEMILEKSSQGIPVVSQVHVDPGPGLGRGEGGKALGEFGRIEEEA
jgi:hypothetical protein